MTIQEIMQDFVNMDDSERVAAGRDACARMLKGLEAAGVDEDNLTHFLVLATKIFVSADRDCCTPEVNHFNAITGLNMSFDEFYEMTNGGANPELVNKFDELVDTLDGETKSAICIYGLALMAADEKLSAAEQALFAKILD